MLIEVARQLAHRKDLTLIICVNGPNRAVLEATAQHVDNLLFHDLQPKERLNDLLNLPSIHLLPRTAAASALFLASKPTNMLASGRPVVAGSALNHGLAREIAACGIAVVPELPTYTP